MLSSTAEDEEIEVRISIGVITAHEAKSLVALLHSHDELLLERTLTTIANCGTFSANQDAIPLLLTFVNKEQPTEKLLLSALLTLSNIAVLSDWHDEFYPVLHALYQLVDTGAPQVKLQALKLLVNLSCNEDMVPSLLAAQCLGWKGEPRDLSGLFFRCPPCQRSTSSTASTPPYRSHLIATYQCPFPSPYPLPDFHSRGYEDPTTFTQRCELQFRIAHVDARMGTYHPTATQGHHRLVMETLWDGYLPSNGNSRTLPPSGGNFMGNILRLRKSSNNV
uniref:Armadillo repeat-containing domain-containing protein n=1 Tax=Timema cristinae TaxID=61476 RepID=A0A7R9CCA1_TIMCR|nr:unnamed protein product [Timema cristinae]